MVTLLIRKHNEVTETLKKHSKMLEALLSHQAAISTAGGAMTPASRLPDGVTLPLLDLAAIQFLESKLNQSAVMDQLVSVVGILSLLLSGTVLDGLNFPTSGLVGAG